MGVDARMVVVVPRNVTEDTVRREAVKLSTAFNAYMFMILWPGQYGQAGGQLALSISNDWEGALKAKKNQTLIEVNLSGRYYGPGYERGDLPGLLAIAKWLRAAFAPCEIWYGGDSGGDTTPALLDAAAEDRLWNHFMSPNGRSYYVDRSFSSGGRERVIVCDLCKIQAIHNLSNGSDGTEGYYCAACNAHFLVKRNGDIQLSTERWTRTSLVAEDAAMALMRATAAVGTNDASIVLAEASDPGDGDRTLTFKIQLDGTGSYYEAFERAAIRFAEMAQAELNK